MIGTLNRTAAARIKADGANCSHLMHEIGMTDEENYGEQLKIAKSDAVVIPMALALPSQERQGPAQFSKTREDIITYRESIQG